MLPISTRVRCAFFTFGVRNAGTTVLMVEQNAVAALEMCDHAYLLESGSLSLSGTGRELADNPHVRNAYLAGG